MFDAPENLARTDARTFHVDEVHTTVSGLESGAVLNLFVDKGFTQRLEPFAYQAP